MIGDRCKNRCEPATFRLTASMGEAEKLLHELEDVGGQPEPTLAVFLRILRRCVEEEREARRRIWGADL